MIILDKKASVPGLVCEAMDGADYTERLCATAARDRRAFALCSTDAAIHTALYLCGVRRGDSVFVPSYTFYSFVATVPAMGAIPIFIDCEPNSRSLSPDALETAFLWATLQDKMPRAVIVDNAFGFGADFATLLPLCAAYNVPVVELAAFPFGDLRARFSVASFNAIGGFGAALVCDSEDQVKASQFIRNEYGENESHDYRMPQVTAAINYALCLYSDRTKKRIDANIAALFAADCIPQTAARATTFAPCKVSAELLTRRGFTVKTPPPVHVLSMYKDCTRFDHEQGFCVSAELCRTERLVGMNISVPKRRRLVLLIKNNTVY